MGFLPANVNVKTPVDSWAWFSGNVCDHDVPETLGEQAAGPDIVLNPEAAKPEGTARPARPGQNVAARESDETREAQATDHPDDTVQRLSPSYRRKYAAPSAHIEFSPDTSTSDVDFLPYFQVPSSDTPHHHCRAAVAESQRKRNSPSGFAPDAAGKRWRIRPPMQAGRSSQGPCP